MDAGKDLGKSLGEILMDLREAIAPNATPTEDQIRVQDYMFNKMSDQDQALLRDVGSILLDAVRELGSEPGSKS